jgi:2-octaprenylphenol hydroxylase
MARAHPKPDFDAIVVGGGMVGAATACGLADLGLKIALLEAHPPELDWPADDIDLRVSAINHASRQLLEKLGAWQRIRPADACAYRHMRVWDSLPHMLHFDSAEIAMPDLGHIVQNRVIQAALWRVMQDKSQIQLHCPARLAAVTRTPAGMSVTLTDGQELTAALLIGADGARSHVRELLHINTSLHDFQQSAVVATVGFASDAPGHRDTAWQRFLPEGPLAFLPITPTQCSIVWTNSPARAEALLQLDDADFCQALEAASEGQLGAIVATSPRAAFSLASIHADHYVQANALLIGDAAHQIHPLAGQGVNLGFRDLCVLLELVSTTRRKGRPLGSLQSLRHYERARRGDNLLMQKSMEGFNRLFSNSNPLLAQLRNRGLSITQGSDFLKRLFMQQALGSAGAMPPLCRPTAR